MESYCKMCIIYISGSGTIWTSNYVSSVWFSLTCSFLTLSFTLLTKINFGQYANGNFSFFEDALENYRVRNKPSKVEAEKFEALE